MMRVAALQYTANHDIHKNCEIALPLVQKAVKDGAEFITLPECANMLAKDKDSLRQDAPEEASCPFIKTMCDAAQSHDIWLSLGSVMCRDDGNQKMARRKIVNRHLIISPDGAITSRYDKIHMFDAAVGDGKIYRESDNFLPGTTPVMTDIAGHKTGLSICYDIRFASLYHHYAKQQADMILTPAAFTATTGKAHWHILQRARAIETGAFIIAAAQIGQHDDLRETYGHALIVSPWGEVLSDAGTDQDMAIADLDFSDVTKARRKITAWNNQTSF